jgi:hypothetical protein
MKRKHPYVGFLASVVFTVKFSGNVTGRIHQMPSVSSSSGRPVGELTENLMEN